MNLLDILSTSPHYFYRKWIGATNENSNFDLRVERVKGDTSKESEDIAPLKVEKFYRRLYGGRQELVTPPPPTLQLLNTTTLRSYICVSFQQIAFLIGSFTDQNAFFPVVLTDFSLTGRRQKSK